MKKHRPHTYGPAKPKPKTVLVTCVACVSRYYLTITGYSHEYVNIIRLTKCRNCGAMKLATSDLAKARPRGNAYQLSLGFNEKPNPSKGTR